MLLEAVSFAARAHRGQFRKDKETPFATHPFRTCMVLRHVFGVADEEVLAAAVLHDTIEDTVHDRDDLIEHFGEKVAGWVSLLSKDKRLAESTREAAYIRQVTEAPVPVKLIKLADIYDNLADMAAIPSAKARAKTLKRVKMYLDGFAGCRNDPALAQPLREIRRLMAHTR